METIKNNEILPNMENFVSNNRTAALKEALRQEMEFKQFFLDEFDKLESKIKEKVKEQENMMKDKEKFEDALAENKKKLAWISEIKNKLENILSI